MFIWAGLVYDSCMDAPRTEKLILALIEKSKEAAYLAVEIMNKPTIHYRTEGFCFFISNAWELLLKAFLVREKGYESIDLPSKDGTSRTKSLSECMSEVFTSTDNPVRSNLSLIIKMRNRATHLVASADDKKYAPGFQVCISNYFQFLKNHFPEQGMVEMTPFISLAVGSGDTTSPVLVNPELSDFFPEDDSVFEPMLKGKLYITKKEAEADFKATITPKGGKEVVTINVPRDIETTHPYTQTTAVKKIREIIAANGLNESLFNKHSFGKIKKDLSLAGNLLYCYKETHYVNPNYFYSQAAIDLIASRFVSDPIFREKYKAKAK